MKQLWIFKVTGGDPFRLQVKGNPVLEHDGGANNVLQTMCTRPQALALEAEMQAKGARVEANCPSETAEQKEQRKNLLKVLGNDRVFPSAKCPECSWFDPMIVSLCGAGFSFSGPGWDDDTMKGVMSNEKYAADFESCPIREDKIQ